MEVVVTLSEVEKAFKGRPVIADASFRLHVGEVLAITGANGSGKSVLLRLMSRLLMPDAGSVEIDPRYLRGRQQLPVEFGVIIDRPGFIPGESGLRNLLHLASIRRVVDEAAVRDAMERVGLDVDLATPVAKYSLGMRQKLALAQAFMEGQKVLLLDEPFNALDRQSVARCRQLVRDLNQEGRTVVFTSHNEADISSLASRVLELDGGRICE